jgi:hypothetical protein
MLSSSTAYLNADRTAGQRETGEFEDLYHLFLKGPKSIHFVLIDPALLLGSFTRGIIQG